MFFLYNLLTHIAAPILKIAALFSPKMKLFVSGRKTVFYTLAEKIQPNDKTVWFHAASLGEYEQGLPVMEKIKAKHPNHKIIVTFFSPSGYEVRKNTKAADVVVYLPLDTKAKAKKFMDLTHPELVFFIKYEFWPNYLNEIKKRNIEAYLISGLFREKQVFFKWYGGFYREALQAFNHLFVQYDSSKKLLQNIGFTNVTVSGDTRYDRVSEILERDNTLPFIEEFIDGKTTIVFGSSWQKGEAMFVDFINNSKNTKLIIAPHTIGNDHISELQNSITKKTVLFTEMEGKSLADYDVFIINIIGILGKIYSYADAAYVGGGFGTAGLHNILEPAAFGVPIIIGPNHQKFPEAVALVQMGGCIAVKDKAEMEEALSLLAYDDTYRTEKGHIAGTFVNMNRGAVDTIMKKITD
ncbi:3-deoxy-D-manno-octulosonic acid transferase [Flavobacterium arcticum]|uniref:3-deoxy-D-manno-octulosonic acid transferase n=1 Tax=Flavobacterium arcticum TaxID=1784713 RepID=A0A345HC80_9FLAO|nr:glycosyltransferase N-terminal domain-containing protein [Flavobacterium arcticum]AXG74190.1 3-deoxy-D-manno-octulosonic acid transferase [Flavobacterium arcticum]KAF2508222.1 3-deoxy-D-manno-octulosonic acid transferase [Flavobacterium arcticum]